MAHTQAICRAEGIPRITWSMYKPNRTARLFYERMGAETVEDLDFMYLTVDDCSGN